MNPVGSASSSMSPAAQAEAARRAKLATLRQKVDEMVGLTFFAPLLKMARSSAIKGEFGHGGRGEEMFRGQLDQLLVQGAGRRVQTSLGDAIYQNLEKRELAGG